MSREKIAQEMLDAGAGYRVEDTALALSDVLGVYAGAIMHSTGKTPTDADALIDEITDNAKAHVRQHWGTIEAAKPS